MTELLLGVQLALATVLGAAGTAKLTDLAGSREAVRNFGLPDRLARPIGTQLPAVELVIAGGLLLGTTARPAAFAAVLLFLIFTVGIAVNLYQGRTPDCHCFGQLHSAPVGRPTLVRNMVLTGAASVIVWQGSRSPLVRVSGLAPAAQIGLGLGLLTIAVLAALVWLMLQLWQQNGRLLLRIEALERIQTSNTSNRSPLDNPHPAPAPRPAPSLDLPTPQGDRISLATLRHTGTPTLLIFSDPKCGPCTLLMPEVGYWQQQHKSRLSIVLISRGDVELNRTKTSEHGITQVGIQHDREVAQAYGVTGTPAAVLVHADGTIRETVAAGVEAIRTLVTKAAQTPPPPVIPLRQVNHASTNTAPPRLSPGDVAPEIALPALDGYTVRLADFRGRDTVVLFWNPGCGFCQRMLPDLKNWEQTKSADAPNLLVVSTGTPEVNRAMGLQSTVVLDTGFTMGRAYGATGTPSALEVRDDYIISGLAVGAPGAFELLGLQPPKMSHLAGT